MEARDILLMAYIHILRKQRIILRKDFMEPHTIQEVIIHLLQLEQQPLPVILFNLVL